MAVAALAKIGITCRTPKASFYLWCKVPAGQTSAAFVTKVLQETGVVLTPCNGFGAPGEGYFRIAMTVPVGPDGGGARTHRQAVRAFCGLGSNLGDRLAHLRLARERLAALPQARLVLESPIYETEPWGDADQPYYANQVVALDLEPVWTPGRLLASIQAIETDAGRVRDPKRRFGPRTLDGGYPAFRPGCRPRTGLDHSASATAATRICAGAAGRYRGGTRHCGRAGGQCAPGIGENSFQNLGECHNSRNVTGGTTRLARSVMYRWLILIVAGFILYKLFMGDRGRKKEQEDRKQKRMAATGEMVKDPVCGTYVPADARYFVSGTGTRSMPFAATNAATPLSTPGSHAHPVRGNARVRDRDHQDGIIVPFRGGSRRLARLAA